MHRTLSASATRTAREPRGCTGATAGTVPNCPARSCGAHRWTGRSAARSARRFVELRAGREGGDDRVLLEEGQALTAETLDALVYLLLTVKFGLEA